MRGAEVNFVSLADALRPRPPAVETIVPVRSVVSEPEARAPLPPSRPAHSNVETSTPEQANAIRSARIFRAAVEDAFAATLGDLVRHIAVEIVARELRLADVEIERIATRLIAERFAEEPVRLRVAPGDAEIVCELPVSVDPALEPGDAVLECRSGSIDARLGVRLAAVLEAVMS